MSVNVSTAEQICKSPLNKSTAKFLFSFSKAERFPVQKKTGYIYFIQDHRTRYTRYQKSEVKERVVLG